MAFKISVGDGGFILTFISSYELAVLVRKMPGFHLWQSQKGFFFTKCKVFRIKSFTENS